MRIWKGFVVTAIWMMAGATAPLPRAGQVILENGSAVASDLYVDEEYLCTAPAHSSCLAEVDAGYHVATIRFPDGDYIISDVFEVVEDMSVTLPVVDLMT